MSSKNGFSMSDFQKKADELDTLQKDIVRTEAKLERSERIVVETREELSTARRRATALSTEVDSLIRRALVDLQKGAAAATNRASLIGVIVAAMRDGGPPAQQSLDVDPKQPAGDKSGDTPRSEGRSSDRSNPKSGEKPDAGNDAGDKTDPASAAA